MNNSLFPTLQRDKLLSDRVAERLQELIIERKLEIGEKLPPERELAEMFGVSRTVIRESLTYLKAKGLVEVQQGGGAVVTNMDSNHLYESISLFLHQMPEDIEYRHIAELRKIVEVEIAGLAADRATDEDIARIESKIGLMKKDYEVLRADSDARHRFARADVEFHLALAVATQNPLLPIMFSPILDILEKQRTASIDIPNSAKRAIEYHEAIKSAIKKRDAYAARMAMRDHLDVSLQIMDAVNEKNKKEDED